MVILICYLSYELCIIKKASQLLSVYDMHLLFYFFNDILVKTFGNYGSRELFNITFFFFYQFNYGDVVLLFPPSSCHVHNMNYENLILFEWMSTYVFMVSCAFPPQEHAKFFFFLFFLFPNHIN